MGVVEAHTVKRWRRWIWSSKTVVWLPLKSFLTDNIRRDAEISVRKVEMKQGGNTRASCPCTRGRGFFLSLLVGEWASGRENYTPLRYVRLRFRFARLKKTSWHRATVILCHRRSIRWTTACWDTHPMILTYKQDSWLQSMTRWNIPETWHSSWHVMWALHPCWHVSTIDHCL